MVLITVEPVTMVVTPESESESEPEPESEPESAVVPESAEVVAPAAGASVALAVVSAPVASVAVAVEVASVAVAVAPLEAVSVVAVAEDVEAVLETADVYNGLSREADKVTTLVSLFFKAEVEARSKSNSKTAMKTGADLSYFPAATIFKSGS